MNVSPDSFTSPQLFCGLLLYVVRNKSGTDLSLSFLHRLYPLVFAFTWEFKVSTGEGGRACTTIERTKHRYSPAPSWRCEGPAAAIKGWLHFITEKSSVRNFSNLMATQLTVAFSSEEHGQIMQPLVRARFPASPQTTEATHESCSVVLAMWRRHRVYCWNDVSRCSEKVCLFAAFPWTDVCRCVQSHNLACVFRLQMSGLTANQQFRSSVTRTERMYMFEVAFQILLSKSEVIFIRTCYFLNTFLQRLCGSKLLSNWPRGN